MSLFQSAFEAGPSKSVVTPNAVSLSQKRKRGNTGGGTTALKAAQLQSTKINLEKLINKVERGAVREKVGNETIGQISKAKRSRSGHSEKKSQQNSTKALSPEKTGSSRNSSSIVKGRSRKQSSPAKESKKNDAGKGARESFKEKSTIHGKKTAHDGDRALSGLPPAELPLPRVEAVEESSEAGLTSMQRSMKSKLEGARFRWINEQLYSTSSSEAVAMMKKEPKIFADYHLTHRLLTSAWPSPPLPHIIKLLQPLPTRTLIIDLGCGDAGLARALVPQGKVVLSFDLVGDSGLLNNGDTSKGTEGWVVEADFLSHIPLPGRPGGLSPSQEGLKKKGKSSGPAIGSEIVDAAVCCLSLMGLNWVGGIYEACRVLKENGSFHIAEVSSRFVSTEAFVKKIESFGFILESQIEPSTHFTLFKFTKRAPFPLGPARGEPGWDERVAEGEQILRGCVYKKR